MTTPLPTAPTARRAATERGWLVLALATITAGLTGPGQTLGVSVFIDHFVEDLSLSRSQVSSAYLVGTLAGATLLPWVGRFIDRRGVRVAQVIVGLLFGLALVNMSLVGGLVWLAVGFTGIRLLGQGSLTLVATVTVSLRFVRNRGTALGIFSMGTAALMALVPVALAVSIDAVGWRSTWLVAAAVVAAVVVPIGWFGLRGLPRGSSAVASAAVDDVRDRVTGPPPGPVAGPVPEPAPVGGSPDRSYDRREAIRTRQFWVLAATTAAAGMMVTALNFHQIDLMGAAGISETAAAALFIPQVVGSTIAGLLVGALGDRFGTRYLPAAGMVLLLVAMVLATAVGPGAITITYATVLGATGGAVRTGAALLLPAWFGTGHLGSIHGVLTFAGVAASALGPVALALAERGLGGYPPAVLALAGLAVAALAFSLGGGAPLRAVDGPDSGR